MTLGFGPQTDTRIIRDTSGLPGTGQALNGQAVANYIAKYATKTLAAPGVPSHRLRVLGEVEALHCSAHYRQMITAAWHLGGNRHDSRFRAWAHMLGYGGHFLTKSRRYSVTFGQLRTPAPTTAARPALPAPTATPGTGPSMRPSSWSSLPLDLRRHRPYLDFARRACRSIPAAREHRGQADAIR